MNNLLTYKERLINLAKTKLEHTEQKNEIWKGVKAPGSDVLLFMDADDKGLIPPSEDFDFKFVPNHPSGGTYGAKALGENFKRFLKMHPTYIDPMSSLAGGFMDIMLFKDFDKRGWNPDYDYSHLKKDQEKYGILPGIGGMQHFHQDIKIGFELGWDGILKKIRYYREKNTSADSDFYDALEYIVLGIQDLIQRHVDDAKKMADLETDPVLKRNLNRMGEINQKLVKEPPDTFYEAVQWFTWYILLSLMYNENGTGGAIDEFLKPYYEKDILSC